MGHPVLHLSGDSRIGNNRIDALAQNHNNTSVRKEKSMDATLHDPVCGMDVTYESAQARSEYNGQIYYFCSLDCKEAFDRAPETYIRQEEDLLH